VIKNKSRIKLKVILCYGIAEEKELIERAIRFYPQNRSLSLDLGFCAALGTTEPQLQDDYDLLVFTGDQAIQNIFPSLGKSYLLLGHRHSFYSESGIEPHLPHWLNLREFASAYIGERNGIPRLLGGLSRHDSIDDYLDKSSGKEILFGNHQELIATIKNQSLETGLVFLPMFQKPAINLCMDAISSGNMVEHILNQLRFLEACRYNKFDDFYQITPDQSLVPETSYSLFAKHYDSYMAHVDYTAWVKQVLAWQAHYSSRKLNRILEVACGTCNVSCRLVKKGFEVFATDKSPQMLLVAESKPDHPQLFQSELTQSLPRRNFDMVLCLFDSINYLLTKKEVLSCLNRVLRSLSCEGLFIFDISTLANSLDNFSDLVAYTRKREGNIVHEAYFDEDRMLQCSKLVFYKKMGKVFTKYEEEHRQYVYLVSEIINIITQTPFELLAIHCLEHSQNLLKTRKSDLDRKYHRLFFILRKPAQ